MSLINFKIKVIIYLFLLGCVIPGYYYNLNEKSMLKWIKKKKKIWSSKYFLKQFIIQVICVNW